MLEQYGFEQQDFVYEPGQFAIRGGIIDIFSFAADKPYRLEFFGNQIDTIRMIDTISQLSIENLTHIALIPNVKTNLVHEERITLLEYISANTLLCIKNIRILLDEIDKNYQKVLAAYQSVNQESNFATPAQLYTNSDTIKNIVKTFNFIEFTDNPYFPSNEKSTFQAAPQPFFKKQLDQLANHLVGNQNAGNKTNKKLRKTSKFKFRQ